jgi:very-short-patch-repair endonuclease
MKNSVKILFHEIRIWEHGINKNPEKTIEQIIKFMAGESHK